MQQGIMTVGDCPRIMSLEADAVIGNDEKMPVEESGNMLIMALSYAHAASDTSLITSYVRPPPIPTLPAR